MRIAALYDIHGNLPALEAVLAEVADEGVDEVVVGGDVVPGPMPSECVDVLAGLDVPVRYIHGNGERDILKLRAGGALTRVPAQFHDTMRWVLDQLSDEQLQAMAGWPATARANLDGPGRVLFCHATPRDDNEIFTKITPAFRLRPLFDDAGADLVVCGHTHMQFDRRVGGVRVVNAGSVGLPFGQAGAFWALVGDDVELRRTEYDLEAAAALIDAGDYPQVAPFDPRQPPDEERMLEVFEAAAVT